VGWGNECGAESLFVDLSRLTDIISDINRFTSRAIPEILEGFAAEDFTKERISSLVVTALNFSGKWREPFPGEQTKTASFRNYNNKISTVNMMSDNDYTARTIKYTLMPEQETYVELPYKTESYYLQCYLPPENDFINFSGCDWSKLNTAAENKIKVSLPKGKIVGESVDLAPLLKDLGVNQVFSAGGLETLDARCFLNKFIHATSVTFDDSRPKFLADDSKPTDSASAETCPEIIFNRPFMFRIVYTGIPDKGCIVIAEGRVLTSEDLMKI